MEEVRTPVEINEDYPRYVGCSITDTIFGENPILHSIPKLRIIKDGENFVILVTVPWYVTDTPFWNEQLSQIESSMDRAIREAEKLVQRQGAGDRFEIYGRIELLER